jgi:hypothetical protein
MAAKSSAIEQIALVLSEPESMPDNTSIVRASSLLHPRKVITMATRCAAAWPAPNTRSTSCRQTSRRAIGSSKPLLSSLRFGTFQPLLMRARCFASASYLSRAARIKRSVCSLGMPKANCSAVSEHGICQPHLSSRAAVAVADLKAVAPRWAAAVRTPPWTWPMQQLRPTCPVFSRLPRGQTHDVTQPSMRQLGFGAEGRAYAS